MAAWAVFLIVFGCIGAVALAGYAAYRLRIRNAMHQEIRSIMAQYMPLGEHFVLVISPCIWYHSNMAWHVLLAIAPSTWWCQLSATFGRLRRAAIQCLLLGTHILLPSVA